MHSIPWFLTELTYYDTLTISTFYMKPVLSIASKQSWNEHFESSHFDLSSGVESITGILWWTDSISVFADGIVSITKLLCDSPISYLVVALLYKHANYKISF